MQACRLHGLLSPQTGAQQVAQCRPLSTPMHIPAVAVHQAQRRPQGCQMWGHWLQEQAAAKMPETCRCASQVPLHQTGRMNMRCQRAIDDVMWCGEKGLYYGIWREC